MKKWNVTEIDKTNVKVEICIYVRNGQKQYIYIIILPIDYYVRIIKVVQHLQIISLKW